MSQEERTKREGKTVQAFGADSVVGGLDFIILVILPTPLR